jgi:hypothetical protein
MADYQSTAADIFPPSEDGPRLVMDEATLRQQLRHAFAADFTVVQELVQNARRAGASVVNIDYDAERRVLTITDDGCGISDFRTLLTFAGSGWNADVAAAERPYGMGFMAAIYAATHVAVTSRGQRLSFSTAALLEGDAARIVPSGRPDQVGTEVCLTGIALRDPSIAMAMLAAGYPIPLLYRGKLQRRPDAMGADGFVATDVGHVKLGDYSCGFAAYLQGFLVYEQYSHRWASKTIVHLDGTRYRGKFPDRDRVINEAQMVSDVLAVLETLFLEHLEALKRSLPGDEFCDQAFELARQLGRLDVFNDVDSLPGHWFVTLTGMPHTLLEGEESAAEINKLVVSRQEVESGQVPLAPFWLWTDPMPVGDECDDRVLRQQIFAYLTGQLVFLKRLDTAHWIHRAMEAADLPVDIEMDVEHECKVPYERTAFIGGTRLLVCDRLDMRVGEMQQPLSEPVAAVVNDEMCVLVPRAKPLPFQSPGAQASATWAHIGWTCLRQCYTYQDENEALDEADLNLDELAATTALDLLVSPTPADYLQRVLGGALHSYREELKRFGAVHIELADGLVSVKSYSEAAPAQAGAL